METGAKYLRYGSVGCEALVGYANQFLFSLFSCDAARRAARHAEMESPSRDRLADRGLDSMQNLSEGLRHVIISVR